MRTPDRRAPLARTRVVVITVMLASLAVACGGPAPSTEPSLGPTPVPSVAATPVAPLVEPATADQVLRALVAAGLKIQPNTATGGPGQDPRKVILASLDGWPLAIAQWSSGKALNEAIFWKPGARPGKGEAPVQFRGLNIMVEWGPIPSGLPTTLNDRQLVTAVLLRDALHNLLSPLTARTFSALPGASTAPTPSPQPTPKATKAPAKGPTPKPTKK